MSYPGLPALIGRPNAVDFRSSESNHIILPSFTARNDIEIHTRIRYENEATDNALWAQYETTILLLRLLDEGSGLKVKTWVRTGNSPNTSYDHLYSSALELGNKYDIRWVISSTLGHRLYINGVLSDSSEHTDGSIQNNFNRSTVIGGQPDASNDIINFINQPMEFMKITVGGTVWAYFPFLTNVKDASGNERDGTFTGGVKWAKI